MKKRAKKKKEEERRKKEWEEKLKWDIYKDPKTVSKYKSEESGASRIWKAL